VSRDDETHRPVFGGSRDLLLERRGNLVIFIPFCNMNLLISFHPIFQDEESLGREDEVEHAGWKEDLEVAGLEETSDGGHDSEEEDEEEGHEEGAGLDNEGVGVTGLLQDPHPHTDLGSGTLIALL
jgi:hypothetical protein